MRLILEFLSCFDYRHLFKLAYRLSCCNREALKCNDSKKIRCFIFYYVREVIHLQWFGSCGSTNHSGSSLFCLVILLVLRMLFFSVKHSQSWPTSIKWRKMKNACPFILKARPRNCSYFLKIMFIDLRERERERNIDLLPPICALTRDQTNNLGMFLDQELNLQPFGLWSNAPTYWATLPGARNCSYYFQFLSLPFVRFSLT